MQAFHECPACRNGEKQQKQGHTSTRFETGEMTKKPLFFSHVRMTTQAPQGNAGLTSLQIPSVPCCEQSTLLS